MKLRPSRASAFLATAIGTLGFYALTGLTGGHPDGALLGFSAAMWTAWSGEAQRAKQRRNQRHRQHHKPKPKLPSSPEQDYDGDEESDSSDRDS